MYRTIQDVQNANAEIGHHFFDRDTLRFFGSRVLDGVEGGRYFVTSERRPRSNDARRYTIRECVNGKINTVGEFQAFKSASSARAEIARILKNATQVAA
ncbi:hypothetical protein UFOVP75_11 [uncultured Caudovirales phage]|uniref:Uncharacterized protein n=1 Tax=uncultured Caudovirales phage TaxID=2100421 RepID=A0A6J5KX11_9CAUD|nr:hypothetical protein UFOVP75_11 [uncultured Caudovirales phage]